MTRSYEQMSKQELIDALRALEAVPPDDATRLIHELRVHQIELEVQNRELREAQQLLEESRSRYADLYDLAPVGYCTLDPDGRVLEANLQAARLFGETRANLVGRRLTSIVAIKDPRLFREHLAACRTSTLHVATELALRNQRGTDLVVQMVSSPLKAGAAPAGCKTTLTDVTALKLSEERMRLVADASELLSSSLDESATLRTVADLTVPMLADAAMIDVLDSDGRMRRYQSGTETREPSPVDPRTPQAAVLRSGEPVVAGSLLLVPLKGRGQTLGVLTLAMEPSARRFTSTELALARDLASRIAHAIDSAHLYQTARRAVRSREDVLAVVSHDLKNPLQSIRLNADSLAPEIELDPIERSKRLGGIQRAVQSMLRMIGDLLDLSRIESGHLTLAPRRLGVKGLMEEVLELWRPLAQEHGIALELRPAPEVLFVDCDRDRILQVFSNLVGNALKFTPRSGRIILQTAAVPDGARFVVRDTGRGIERSALPHVFDRYWHEQRLRHGSGLGLFIAKGIVEAHGGRIDVDSERGVGTSVCFTLPRALEAPAEAIAAAAGAPVLIVEDDCDLRAAITTLLEAHGYPARPLANGAEAMRYLHSEQRRPCLIVLDLNMPVMDGWRLGAELKADPSFASIPFVVMSSAADLAAEAESLGAAGWLPKPVELQSVLDAVESRFGRRAGG